jgi:hypothetical protein
MTMMHGWMVAVAAVLMLMTSGWYQYGLQAFARALVAWLASGGSTIKATMYDAADYTPNLTTHQYMNLDTVPAAAKVRVSSAMTLIDAAPNGVVDAENVVESAVSGDSVEGVLLWKDGGGGGTTQSGTADLLLGNLESSITPNGGDITIQWGNVAGLLLGRI